MTILFKLRAAIARAGRAAALLANAYLIGGPVGLFYSAKLAWIRRRLSEVSVQLHRENELHRENVRTLNHELNALIDAQQAANHAAGEYWKGLGSAGHRS